MTDYKELYDFAIKNECSAVLNEPMSKHTSFKIGGEAALLITPQNVQALSLIIKKCREKNARIVFLGNGSNMLVSDQGINAVVISLCNDNSKAEYLGNGIIKSDAGVSLSKLCRLALSHSLSGLEFAFGIPGTVGGAVYMNAGAYGGEIKDVITKCDYITCDGEIKTMMADEMKLGYRTSIFNQNSCAIISAEFKLENAPSAEIKEKMDSFLNKRKTKQPLEYPSAGSTFKRPDGYFAGALIEECNLKGKSIGGAQVSEKHAGFIINKDGASANDVVSLIEHIKETVYNKFGVELEPEVKILK